MKLKIKNIGPFNDASIDIGDITIIAGINDTGKSYLSRLIFAMLKITTNDIETQIITNFLNFMNDIFGQIKTVFNDFMLANFNNHEQKTVLFNEINDIYQKLISINELFIKVWISNFENKKLGENFNIFWTSLLTNCAHLLAQNDELITKTLVQIDLTTNKDDYKIKTIKYTLNIIKQDINDMITFFKDEEKDVISYLITNILTENFHHETLKNKKYLTEDSELILKLANNILKININKNNNFILDNDFKHVNYVLANNSVRDVTYISNLESVLDIMLTQQQQKTNLEYLLTKEKLKLSINNIFKFKNCHYDIDFKTKINNCKTTESNLKMQLIKEKISVQLDNYFLTTNKINFQSGTINNSEFDVKLVNSSRGLKIIMAFKELVNNNFFIPGTLVIIDEPEAYIHPEWQYLLTRVLLDIATIVKFKLIISTHSPYIIETINSLSLREFKDFNFTYNFINKDKNNNSCIINKDSLNHINEALSYPYRELDKYEFDWEIKK